MSRILLMGAPFEVVSSKARTVEENFQATGKNTGNLLIGNGLVSQLNYSRLEVFNYSMTPDYIQENFDRVAVAAANFLHPKFDFSAYSTVLDKISLPVLMVGLGAQSPTSSAELDGIPQGTWRLVEIASERSTSVGVRGYFTADVLRRHGINNLRVIGCPSLFTNGTSSLRIRRPGTLDMSRVVMNGSRNVTGHSNNVEAALRVEKELFHFALKNRIPFVYQNEEPEMQTSLGAVHANQKKMIVSLSKFFRVPAESFVQYTAECGRTFFSVSEWFEWIKGFDFSFGTRFHGNMAALLNGVPAVVITHDSRTRELCEFAAIPHVSVEETASVDPQSLYDAANYDLFEERYNALARKYVEFLNENGVSHKLKWQPDLLPRGRLSLSKATN
jgi:hypothetical protein